MDTFYLKIFRRSLKWQRKIFQNKKASSSIISIFLLTSITPNDRSSQTYSPKLPIGMLFGGKTGSNPVCNGASGKQFLHDFTHSGQWVGKLYFCNGEQAIVKKSSQALNESLSKLNFKSSFLLAEHFKVKVSPMLEGRKSKIFSNRGTNTKY